MRRIAIDFMKKQGVEPDGKSFRLHKRNNEYQVFADNSKGQFVVVADEKYHDYVKNPVLAFSFNSQYKPNEFTYSLFDFYVKELKALQERGVSSEGFFNKDNSSSEILLEGIEYGQGAPFNYYCPETGSGRSARKSLVGCVPVALAQQIDRKSGG